MAASKKGPFVADKPAHWEALTSPVRNQIIQLLINIGPSSVRDIAEQLGRKPASLYRHIDQLLAAGILDERGLKPTTRRDAVVYGFCGTTIRTKYDQSKKRDRDAIERYTRIVMRHAQREMCAAVESGTIRRAVDDANYALMHALGWLDKRQLKGIRKHMLAIESIIESAPRRRGTELVALTFALRPAKRTDSETG